MFVSVIHTIHCLIIAHAYAPTGFLITSFTQNYSLTVLAYGIMGGIGTGMAFTPALIVISLYFERYRAIATGIVYCGSSLGALSLAYTFQSILDAYGRSFTHRLQAALMAIACVCVFSFRLPDMVELTIDEDVMDVRTSSKQSSLSLAMSPREFNSGKWIPLRIWIKTFNPFRYCSLPSSNANGSLSRTMVAMLQT